LEHSNVGRFADSHYKEWEMGVKGEVKEAAGYIKEEAYEHGKSAESKRKAQEGRDLRNEGRIEDGKAPKTSKPGTGSK
jgi:hypothetical protein